MKTKKTASGMERRTFLKYLCMVVPASLVNPASLVPESSKPIVGRWVCDGYVDGKPVRWHSADVYESGSENLDDILLGIIRREGWSDGYLHIKIR